MRLTFSIINLRFIQKYINFYKILSQKCLILFFKSRAALSLLAYCYYYIQDYVNASDCYEQLSMLCPDQEQYKLYYAQSLYKCGLYVEAMRVSSQIDNPNMQTKAMKLQAAVKYAEDDIKACVVPYAIKTLNLIRKNVDLFCFIKKEYVERSPSDDSTIEINKACILFKESKLVQALERFQKAQQILGARPGLNSLRKNNIFI